MTEPAEPTPPLDELASMPNIGRGYQISIVVQYIERNRARFTEDALVQTALRQGYPQDVVEAARARARANEASAPTRHRARRWISLAYLLTFGVLTTGMLIGGGQYGAGVIATPILGVTLGLAFLLSLGWLGWRGRKTGGAPAGMLVFLSVPIVLLVGVAGLCLSTGLPIPRTF